MANAANAIVDSGGTYYGRETHEKIIRGYQTIILDGTTVTRNAFVFGSIVAMDANVGSLKAGREVTLLRTTCHSETETRGQVTAVGSSIGSITSEAGGVDLASSKVFGMTRGGSVSARNCSQLGEVVATENNATVVDCPSVRSVIAKDLLEIWRSHVLGNVSTERKNPIVENSTIDGRLTCTSNDLTLRNCTIDTIELCADRPEGVTSIQIGGKRRGVSMIQRNTGGGISIQCAGDLRVDERNVSHLFRQAREEQQQRHVPQRLELIDCIVRRVIFKDRLGALVLQGSSRRPEFVEGERV